MRVITCLATLDLEKNTSLLTDLFILAARHSADYCFAVCWNFNSCSKPSDNRTSSYPWEVISRRMSSRGEPFCQKKIRCRSRSREIFRSSYNIDIWRTISLQICEIFRFTFTATARRTDISRSAGILRDHVATRKWKIRIACENEPLKRRDICILFTVT